MGDTKRFRALLNEHYDWPAKYTFKFVVPSEEAKAVKKLFRPGSTTARPSKTGKYVSLTAEVLVEDADAVVRVYERAAHIRGIIAL